ncbi:unnamed protein product [Durusdinium trenchii]|uniref:Uncharacterized protein n=2 Tax=Durusdinium trenchii TaxID=1381693 RepID=A0ABP0MDV4_9DINO
MDLDEKEKQLEEQQNRVQSLSNVLAKQQNVGSLELQKMPMSVRGLLNHQKDHLNRPNRQGQK